MKQTLIYSVLMFTLTAPASAAGKNHTCEGAGWNGHVSEANAKVEIKFKDGSRLSVGIHEYLDLGSGGFVANGRNRKHQISLGTSENSCSTNGKAFPLKIVVKHNGEILSGCCKLTEQTAMPSPPQSSRDYAPVHDASRDNPTGRKVDPGKDFTPTDDPNRYYVPEHDSSRDNNGRNVDESRTYIPPHDSSRDSQHKAD